jgi:hypothetical protein
MVTVFVNTGMLPDKSNGLGGGEWITGSKVTWTKVRSAGGFSVCIDNNQF